MPLEAAQAHYLFGVMRKGVGEVLEVFDGRNGTWEAEVVEARKKGGVLLCRAQIAAQRDPPDLWLLFAPIKKVRTDFIVEKAAEMGARRIVPVLTDFTNSERVRADRLQAHAVEAAEQCGGNFVPEVTEAVKLDRLLAGWDPARRVIFCDESAVGLASDFRRTPVGPESGSDPGPRSGPRSGPWAILIGPEGGFSEAERDRLRGLDYAHAVSLGPRILRADTAAVAALTLWQSALGDWT